MKIRRWEAAGAAFTLLFGTLLHFVYRWSDGAWLAALIAPVNESVWEHLKLVFTPILIFSAVGYFAFGRRNPAFLPTQVMSLLLAMGSIVLLFYTYTGIVGRSYFAADILIFLITVLAAFSYSRRRLSAAEPVSSDTETVCALLAALVITSGFVLFTFCPPHIGLFADPVTGAYGIPR